MEKISIHALCEEGDPCGTRYRRHSEYFYPRPLRGGRHDAIEWIADKTVISIHALCEEGDPVRKAVLLHRHISIHALCEEGDRSAAPCPIWQAISIHALCEEGD